MLVGGGGRASASGSLSASNGDGRDAERDPDPEEDEFARLFATAAELGRIGAATKQSGQEQLDLRRLVGGSGSSRQNYYLDQFSRVRVPGVGSTVPWEPALAAVDCRPIPRAIRGLYSQIECEMFMGLFPEINRAWITIDNRLFLWNYYNGDDFYVYDGLDQLIVSVGLARPRRSVLGSDVDYVMVLSTPVEVVLLTLKLHGDTVFGEITLSPTEFTLATDNVPMRSIAGTKDGRIFMGGHDGSLYEFLYESPGMLHSLGLKRQCRKVELSGLGAPVKWLVPSFIRNLAGSPDPLVKVVIDHERGLLYTLSDKSALRLHKFSKNSGFDSVKAIENMAGAIRKFVADQGNPTSRTGLQSGNIKGIVRIVSVNVVRKLESQSLHLVAILHTGVRVYFTTQVKDRDGRDLRIFHVRGPPNKDEVRKASRGGADGLVQGGNSTSSLLGQRRGATSRAQIPARDEGIKPGPEMPGVVSAGFYSSGITLLAGLSDNITSEASGSDAIGHGAEHIIDGFSTDLGMRDGLSHGITDASEQMFSSLLPAYPPLRWHLEDFHEMMDKNLLQRGPTMRETTVEGNLRSFLQRAPVGRVWAITEATFDTKISDEEEMVYAHMLYAPSAAPALKNTEQQQQQNGRVSGSKRKAAELNSSSSTTANGKSASNSPSKAFQLSELSTQHVLPRRYFFALSSDGLWVITKNQPINQLYALLKGPDPGTNADIEEFFKLYGLDESCAMCLAIACRASADAKHEHISTASLGEGEDGPFGESPSDGEAAKSQWVAQRASLWYRRIGYGIADLSQEAASQLQRNQQFLPCFPEQLQQIQQQQQQKQQQNAGSTHSLRLGNSSTQPGALVSFGMRSSGILDSTSIIHSGCYMGLGLHASRLMRAFWEFTVTMSSEMLFKATDQTPVVRCRFSPGQIELLVRPLLRLRSFLKSQQPFADAVRSYAMATNDNFETNMSSWAVNSGRLGMPRAPSAVNVENRQIGAIYTLIDRAIQSLLLFDILQTSPGMRFGRLVTYIEGRLRAELNRMTWRDLVITHQGKVIACALVKALVARSAPEDARELVERMEGYCAAFFSEGDALQISAFEEIASAERAATSEERNKHLQKAMARLRDGFEKIAPRLASGAEITFATLQDAIEKFEKLGRSDFAVGLALFCARCFALLPLDVLPPPRSTSTHANAAKSKEDISREVREFCYENALQVLSRCLPKDGKPIVLRSGKGGDTMQEALRQAVTSEDALWHFTYYAWLLSKGRKAQLMGTQSPFVVGFLGDPLANNPENAAEGVYEPPLHRNIHKLLQVEWYAKHGDNAKAASVAEDLAKLDVHSSEGGFQNRNPTLDQRVSYFTMALTFAKASQTPNLEKNGIDMGRLQEELDVAKLQVKVVQALQDETKKQQMLEMEQATVAQRREIATELHTRQEAIEELMQTLHHPTDLYNQYAYKFQLWEACISIMQECDCNDQEELEIMYLNILQGCSSPGRMANLHPLQNALSACVLRLGAQFYGKGKDFAFPHQFLIRGLEDLYTFYPGNSDADWDPWVLNTMTEVGLPFSKLLQAYSDYYQKIKAGSSPTGQLFLAGADTGDVDWYSERSKLHVATAIAYLINIFKEKDPAVLTNPMVGDLLDSLLVTVGGIHSDDIRRESRSRTMQALNALNAHVDRAIQ